MANVSYETGQIKSAIYGEEVRDAIISALLKVAKEGTDVSQLVDEFEAQLSERIRQNTATLSMKGDDLYFDEEESLLYLMCDGQPIGSGVAVSAAGGGGGGGGGGGQYFFRPTLVNDLPDRNITAVEGRPVELRFTYASVDETGADDGNGIGRIVVGNQTRKTFSALQGSNTVDVTDILGIGENRIAVKVENSEGTVRVLNYVINVLTLSLTTTTPDIMDCHGAATVYYTVTGSGDKVVHFILDGSEIGSEIVASSGRSRSYIIDPQRHGDHILEIYAETDNGDIHLESDRLRLALYWVGSETTPIISTPFNQTEAVEGDTIRIPYAVYDPSNELATVTLSVIDGNGEVYSSNTIVKDRSASDPWIINDFPYGNITFRIACRDTVKNISVSVKHYVFPISRVTDSLALEFTPNGRSNLESNPATWEYNGIEATFDGFSWSEADGWLHDENEAPILRFLPGDTMEIGFKPFENDIVNSGYTIEIELATRDVRDFNSIVIGCLSEGKGFTIGSQKALLSSEQNSVSMLFREDSHIRITFVVEQKAKTRMIYIYINGIMCGITQYALNDSFIQRTPEKIKIGTSSCGLDLYGMHFYGKELSRNEQLDNLICDKPTLRERQQEYNKNNILGLDESVSIDKLPIDLPTMVISCGELPQFKGDAKTATVTFTDPSDRSKSFVASNASVDVQGTTSSQYPTKNYTIDCVSGFNNNGTYSEKYQLRPGDIPVSLFCIKVDYASSEGVNNVGLVQLYEDICKEQGWLTPPQQENPAVRQGIAGRPIALFWHDTIHNETVFLSKANFNNDKDTATAFGFDQYPDAECWDFRNNSSDRTLWKSDDFSNVSEWETDLKAIYPKKNRNTTNLKRVFTFVSSHNTENCETEEEKQEMLADFKAHFSEYFATNNLLFYYLFTEFFLMIDSRAKNIHLATYDGLHWYALPYDMDTALGIKLSVPRIKNHF